MSSKVRTWGAGLMVLAVAMLAYVADTGDAGEGDAAKGEVRKIAAAIKKGDMDGAKKMAEGLAKKIEDIHEVMDLFKTKKKGGDSPFPEETEGIETKLRKTSTGSAKVADAGAWEEAAYTTAAIAQVALARPLGKESGKLLKKDWNKWTQEMHDGALELAKAARSKGAAEIKTAATKVNTSCNTCHSTFRQ